MNIDDSTDYMHRPIKLFWSFMSEVALKYYSALDRAVKNGYSVEHVALGQVTTLGQTWHTTRFVWFVWEDTCLDKTRVYSARILIDDDNRKIYYTNLTALQLDENGAWREFMSAPALPPVITPRGHTYHFYSTTNANTVSLYSVTI